MKSPLTLWSRAFLGFVLGVALFGGSPPAFADCTPAPAGLIGWWKGDGTSADAITGASAVLANVTYTAGVVGQAFSQDPENYAYGVYTGIQVADRPEFVLTNALTIEGWIRPRGDGYAVLSRGDNRPGYDPYGLGMQDGPVLSFTIENENNVSDTVSTTLVYSNWVHVAATFDHGAQNISLYTNGVLAASKSTSIVPIGQLIPENSPGLGIGNVNDNFNDFPFYGDLDEISLYNRALTPSEIQAIYNAGSAGKCLAASRVPAISSLAPAMAAPGNALLISGINFSPVAASNIVLFGAVPAGIMIATPTALTVGVPVGATLAPITVTVGGLTAFSPQLFTPTFDGLGTLDTNCLASGFSLTVGGSPASPVIGDLDGDGWPDLVVLSYSDNSVSIYRNIGANSSLSGATFGTPVVLSVAGHPNTAVLADLDGDGRLDIVIADSQNGQVSVFRNLSSPGAIQNTAFAPRVDFPVGQGTFGIAVADFNGDGLPDIVTANTSDSTISLLQNTGSPGGISAASFAPHADLPTGASPECLAVGDLDGDGRPDIATANIGDSTVSIFRNLGSSTLSASSFAPPIVLAENGGGEAVAIADLDGDGKPDLLVSGYLSGLVSVFQNLSTLGNLIFASRVDFSTGGRAHRVTLSDLDGDGKLDLAVTTELPSQLLLFKNLSTPGTFSSSSLAAPVSFSTGWNPSGTAIGDLDGDDRPDVVLVNTYDGNASLYRNTAPFSVQTNPPTILSQSPSQTVALGATATFAVVATGTAPLFYSWSRNATPIPGATNATYSLVNAQLSDTGSAFTCLVTNAYGSAVTTNAYLKVIETVPNGLCNGAILITSANYTNTQSTLKAGGAVNPIPDCIAGFGHGVWYQIQSPATGLLSVDTFGSDFDTGLGLYAGSCDFLTEVACNDDSAGGQTSQIIVPTVAGTSYYILAGGFQSDAGNLVIHVTYLSAPYFDVQPASISVPVGSNTVLSASVSGAAPISFRWYFNNAPLADGGRISGSATPALTVSGVTLPDGGYYQLVASNYIGMATSSVATLAPVILPPEFIQPPSSLSVGLGSNATFSALVGGTPPFAYQWSFNGYPLTDDGFHVAGANTSSLSISNLTVADAGSYSLTASNASGTATATATLSVLTPPVFTVSPKGRSVPPGFSTLFTFQASGNPAPSWQWQLNGTNIPGAVNNSYLIPAVGSNNLGSYSVIASNLMGSIVSSPALLTFGPVAAWGNNAFDDCIPPAGLSNVIAVAGDGGASFALRNDGTIAAWGGLQGTNLPPSATNVAAIASSQTTADYALRSDGSPVGWAGASIPPLSNIVALAAAPSGGSGIAVRAEGSVVAWGLPSALPPGLNHIAGVALASGFSVALRYDGSLVAWGSGPGTNLPANLGPVTAISAGYSHCLALRTNGTVAAWGRGACTNVPPSATNIVAISAGGYPQGQNLSVAIRADGTTVAWGDNYYGETNVPAAMTNLFAVAGAAAPYRSLAIVNDGRPLILNPPVGLTAFTGRSVTLHATAVGAAPLSFQWLFNGANLPGATNASLVIPNVQLAHAGNYQLSVTNSLGSALSLPAPVTVMANNALVFLSQPSASSTNVYQGGKLTLYGGTVLGSGPLTYQWYFSPTSLSPYVQNNYSPVPGATNDSLTFEPALASQSGSYYLTVSNQFHLVLSSASVGVRVMFAKAWGFQPTDAPFVLTNASAIALGYYGSGALGPYFTLSSAGKILSWSGGYTQYGETNFSSLSNSIVTAIAAGNGNSLALKSDGTVLAVGNNIYGTTNVPTGLDGVTAIACGDYHDLALRYDGTVVGWGQNSYGQTTNTNATNVVAIAAGGQDSIALREDGSVTTWGNYGSLRGGYPIPANVSNIVAVAAGTSHFLALTRGGTVIGWGPDFYGQILIPANWTNIVAVSAGGTHSTALRNDGTVFAIGSYVNGSSPNIPPSDLANVIAIASSGDRDLGLFGTRAPAFTVQPWSRTIPVTATSVWFSAKCAGVQPMRYQWKFNGLDVPGATNDTLIVNAVVTNSLGQKPAALPLQSGVYQLVASNAYGAVASHYAHLAVVIPLAVALNATNQTWTTTGDAPWFGQTNITHDGIAAAQSGDIGPFQESFLRTTVATNVPGNYSFWWNISSELGLDVVEFRVNGIVQASISGDSGWQSLNLPVAAGTNVLTWRYYKNDIYSSGLDAAWVDQFSFVPSPTILRQPSSITAYAGNTAVFSVTANSSLRTQPFMGYQWQRNGVNLVNNPSHVSGSDSYMLGLIGVQDADAGAYTVIITNAAGGSIISQPATLTVLDSPPIITQQPLTNKCYAGTTASMTAYAVGAFPMHFEWYKNGLDTGFGGGASGAVGFTINNAQASDAGIYSVVFTNLYGCTTSAPAELTVVDGPPIIDGQPGSAVVLRGQPASLIVAASGTAPLSYQWQHNGTNILGATNATLTFASASFSDRGSYQVVLSNRFNVMHSTVATLGVVRSLAAGWGSPWSLTQIPAIPADVTAVSAGNFHTLALTANGTVTAWGTDPLGQTDVPAGLTNVIGIAAGDNHSLALLADGTITAWGNNSDGQASPPAGLSDIVQVAAGGGYSLALRADGRVIAWGYNANGETDVPTGLSNVVAIAADASGSASLALKSDGTVVAWGTNGGGQTSVPPDFTNGVAIAVGGSHCLALRSDGTIIAWGNDAEGETDVPAGLTNAVAIGAGTQHSLAVRTDGTIAAWGSDAYAQIEVPGNLTNAVAIDGSAQASFAIQSDGSPFIIRQPLTQWAASNATVHFSVAALGVPALGYQWQKNGVNLSDTGNVAGSRTPTLTLSNVQWADVANYTVIITNAIDSLTSRPAALVLAGPPVILVQPAGQTANYGANVQFNIVAVGNPSPTYTWWQNETNAVGGNSPSLTLTAVSRAQAGNYSVKVVNSAGGTVSSNALLKVLVPQLLSAPVLTPGGAFQLTSGDVGGGTLSPADLPNFDLQTSTNLIYWVTVPHALSLTNGSLTWQDNARTNFTKRFYRIVEH